MKNVKMRWPVISYFSAFLIGVILFWAFGKNWLELESALIFLAGLIGIAVAVLALVAWNIGHSSRHKDD